MAESSTSSCQSTCLSVRQWFLNSANIVSTVFHGFKLVYINYNNTGRLNLSSEHLLGWATYPPEFGAPGFLGGPIMLVRSDISPEKHRNKYTGDKEMSFEPHNAMHCPSGTVHNAMHCPSGTVHAAGSCLTLVPKTTGYTPQKLLQPAEATPSALFSSGLGAEWNPTKDAYAHR